MAAASAAGYLGKGLNFEASFNPEMPPDVNSGDSPPALWGQALRFAESALARVLNLPASRRARSRPNYTPRQMADAIAGRIRPLQLK